MKTVRQIIQNAGFDELPDEATCQEVLTNLAKEVCGLGDEARAAALTLSGQSPEENEVGTLLLAAIRDIFHN